MVLLDAGLDILGLVNDSSKGLASFGTHVTTLACNFVSVSFFKIIFDQSSVYTEKKEDNGNVH